MIVVVGDRFTPGGNHQAAQQVLSSLKAPLGVWVVRGNHEHWHPVRDEKQFYAAAGVRLLVNSQGKARSDISVVGFDDPWIGSPSIELAEKGLDARSFRIALFHAPAFFDKAAGRYPLCIAGHTHGGQIRIPGVKPILPGGCGRYVEGWYSQKNSRMYVTRGIGTSVLPLRFRCRPEIPVITLSN